MSPHRRNHQTTRLIARTHSAGLRVTRFARGLCFTSVCACAFAALPGCSVFSKDDDILDDPYASGVFRPEGVSADRTRGKTNLMRQLGLHRARRKDKALAESQFADAESRFEAAKKLPPEQQPDAFRDAAVLYEKAAENWKSSALEQDALFGAGECYFFAEQYYKAEQTYTQLAKEYPKNRYLGRIESRKFEIADYWLKLDAKEQRSIMSVNFTDSKQPWNDTGGHGRRVLENLRINNPTGDIGDDATMRLAMERFEAGEFEEAAHTFAELRTIYPDSEHQFNAQFLELQSHLASYQGPEYSSIPLQEAEKRVKQIARIFPVEAQAKQKELNEAYSRIRYLKAERIWENASYYTDRGENGSAKFHLRRILSDYAETPFAEKASERMAKLEGKPDEPPVRLEFLADLFGETTDTRPWLRKNKD